MLKDSKVKRHEECEFKSRLNLAILLSNSHETDDT